MMYQIGRLSHELIEIDIRDPPDHSTGRVKIYEALSGMNKSGMNKYNNDLKKSRRAQNQSLIFVSA